MLTRFVRNQLIIFTIASIVGVAVMLFAYMQVPTLLGVGRINVKLELPAAGGLYRFANVTYRGVEVGKVTDVKLTENGAEATLTLDTSPKIPADLQAEVRSVSAVGEQYVDLRPRTDSGPYLEDGSVIDKGQRDDSAGGRSDARSGQLTGGQHSEGPDLRPARRVVQGVQRRRASTSSRCSTPRPDLRVTSTASPTRPAALIDDSGPLLDSQAETTDQIRTWARSLAGRHRADRTERSAVRAILQTRTRLRAGGFALLNAGEADAADPAGQPHHRRPDPRHLQPVARTVAGDASRRIIAAQQSFGLPKNQPDGPAAGRLRADHQRSAAVHGRVPAAVAVA